MIGKVITEFCRSGDTEPDLEATLKGKEILDVFRLGKYIVFQLNQGCLISHLRMTGQWFCADGWYEEFFGPGKNMPHLRWAFMMVDDKGAYNHMWFSDVRKFGTLEYVDDYRSYPPIRSLGPDGLDLRSDEARSFVEKKLLKSSKPIKNILLDQTVIAGIGNIYASSILWEIGVSPLKPSKECIPKVNDLCGATVTILEEAIKYGGSSISDYLGGTYHERLKVYGKEGQPCPRCSTEISKITQAGRSTFYCPNCQQ